MCTRMMEFPLFRDSMEKADAIYRGVDFNFLDMLKDADDDTFDNPINSFTGIIATQVSYQSMVIFSSFTVLMNTHLFSFSMM